MYSEFITAYSAHKSRAAAQQQQQIELYVLQCQWLPYAATSPAIPLMLLPRPGLSQHPLVALSPKLLPPLEMADDGQKRQIEGALYAVCTTLIIAPR